METVSLFPDFKEFLKLLNSADVRYLLLGGYAVNFHGHYRTAGDLHLWIAIDPQNAQRLSDVLQQFGFSSQTVPPTLFLQKERVFRFGIKPVRIELLTSPTGVNFDECYARRIEAQIDGVRVPVISLPDLRLNKQAARRLKDQDDLLNLPTG